MHKLSMFIYFIVVSRGGEAQLGRAKVQLVPAGTKKAFAPCVKVQVQVTSNLYLYLQVQVQVQIQKGTNKLYLGRYKYKSKRYKYKSKKVQISCTDAQVNCITVFQEQSGAHNLTKVQIICAKVQIICAKVQINLCLAQVQKKDPRDKRRYK